MAFGEILRNARIQKGLSPSDVAEGTRMLVQIVDALEREDLKRIAAPIYGRGFVKLYAEFLELDHEPLVRDFMELYDGGRAPSIRLKTPEVRVDPAPVPVTRTVSESVVPDKHAAKPQATVKSVETDSLIQVSGDRDDELEKPKIRDVSVNVDDGIVSMALQEEDRALVVNPEDDGAEALNEPDLFNLMNPPRQKPELIKNTAVGKTAAEKPRLDRRNQRLPVFKIGGQMNTDYMRDVGKERAHTRLEAITTALTGACGRLREAAVRVCPDNLPGMKVLVLGGAGLVTVLIMFSGLRVIFKLTGKNVADAPASVVERVAPPPELYVD